MNILRTHHVAIICTDYQKSKHFYAKILGLEIISDDSDKRNFPITISLRARAAVNLIAQLCERLEMWLPE